MIAKSIHRARVSRVCTTFVALSLVVNPGVSLACGDAIDVELAQMLEDTMARFSLDEGSESAIQNYHYVLVSAARKSDRRHKETACRLLVASLRVTGQLEERADLYAGCPVLAVEEGSDPDATMSDLAKTVYRTSFLPFVRVAPVYPGRALNDGLEGNVDLAFTVTPGGLTSEIRAIDSTDSTFERAAIGAVKKFRYKPCVRDGRPIAVKNVITRVTFRIEPGDRQLRRDKQQRRLW